MKEQIMNSIDNRRSLKVDDEFKKLIQFIDAAMIQAFTKSGDERAVSLLKNILNIRDYMSSEIMIETTARDLKSDMSNAIDNFLLKNEVEFKKKEDESEEELPAPANLSEIDQ
tara:strand:- start:89 stop:427 length:339 start_codon:yes stop_codon:yes gene_type:complete